MIKNNAREYAERNSAPAVLRVARRPMGVAAARDREILTTRVGLMFPALLSFETWQRAGQQIHRLHDSSAWCLGDWLVYGQDEYTERYRTVIDAAGLDYQTLRNYAWIARRFPIERRRENLSFQHHAEVAALPPEHQDHLLDLAEDNGWSRNQLRRHARAAKGAAPAPAVSEVFPRLSVSDETMRRWRAAAECSSSSLEQWIVESLDRAARRSLPG